MENIVDFLTRKLDVKVGTKFTFRGGEYVISQDNGLLAVYHPNDTETLMLAKANDLVEMMLNKNEIVRAFKDVTPEEMRLINALPSSIKYISRDEQGIFVDFWTARPEKDRFGVYSVKSMHNSIVRNGCMSYEVFPSIEAGRLYSRGVFKTNG